MEQLNTNEQRVLELVRQDPYLTQAEIGETLNLNRSTVATIIQALTRKGRIQGRAYVVKDAMNVYCIGGMNIDRNYRLLEPMLPQTSNPVTSSVSVGGVGRNVAENLGRLGMDITLLSVAGNDQDYQYIKQQSEPYINLNKVKLYSNQSTSAYSAILDTEGEMSYALADMSIADQMNREWINEYLSILSNASYIIVDLNVQKEVIEELLNLSKQSGAKLIIVPVSGPKMSHLPKRLEGLDWLIVNQDESEVYFNLEAGQESTEQLAHRWIDCGVQHVVITSGKCPTVYANQQGECLAIQPPLQPDVVDVTGAGDSNAAGIIYGCIHGLSAQESIELGMTNAYYTVATHQTVRSDLSATQLKEERELLFETKKGN